MLLMAVLSETMVKKRKKKQWWPEDIETVH